MINEVTIVRAKAQNSKTLFYRVNYKGEQVDNTGLGGTWQSSGVLLDIHLVDDHFVGLAWTTSPKIVVKNNLQDLLDRIKLYTKCDKVTFVDSDCE